MGWSRTLEDQVQFLQHELKVRIGEAIADEQQGEVEEDRLQETPHEGRTEHQPIIILARQYN